MNNSKVQCAVGILTFNSGETLKAALESVSGFAEIVICDGGSTDDTLALARAYGAKILVDAPEFKDENKKAADFAGIRNQMLSAATCKWFFALDSDELMTKELESEIFSVISNRCPPTAFWVPRKYSIDGELVLCAATYPTRQMRFFHRDAVNGFIKTVHERIEVKSGALVSELQNYMLVPFNSDPSFHRRKWVRYIELEAVRRGEISFWGWLFVCAENLKISTLFLFRYVRNLFFCRGKRMPWKLEWERHMYHVNICRRFWRLRKR